MNNFKGQTKRPKKASENAITLVALIITIIILIILAAVTINSLTHDGLADLAVKASQDYQKEQTNEMEKLNEIDTMVKETLKNIEDGTVIKPAPTDPEEPEKPVEPTPAPAPEDRDEPFNPNIDTTYGGLAVDYTPSTNNYNVESTYSGYNSDQTFGASDLAAGWQVWGTDDNYIYIISTNATTKTLYLQGALGYNNGVTLLDNICDTVYTDKTTYPGSAGQNLKLEQVLAVKASSVSNDTESSYGTQPYSYTLTYPYIWDTYEKSQNNSVNNKSKAYALTTNTTAASQSYKPYYTLWNNHSMNTSSAWINSNYYSMVMMPGQNKTYWLSSRFAYPSGSSDCYFGLQRKYLSGMEHLFLCTYNNASLGSNANYDTVRPVVSFPTSSYALDTSSTPAKIVKN